MRTFFLTFCFALIALTLPVHADADDDKLKSIVGTNMQQLQSCQKDSDCALVNDFRDCCKWLAVNSGKRELVIAHSNELFQSLATPETQHRCAMLECEMPRNASAVCEQGQCVVK